MPVNGIVVPTNVTLFGIENVMNGVILSGRKTTIYDYQGSVGKNSARHAISNSEGSISNLYGMYMEHMKDDDGNVVVGSGVKELDARSGLRALIEPRQTVLWVDPGYNVQLMGDATNIKLSGCCENLNEILINGIQYTGDCCGNTYPITSATEVKESTPLSKGLWKIVVMDGQTAEIILPCNERHVMKENLGGQWSPRVGPGVYYVICKCEGKNGQGDHGTCRCEVIYH